MADVTISRGRAAVAGILSAAAGLGVAELCAGALGVRQTPVVALGAAFIDVVPPWLKDLAISLFGTADKLVLIVGILIVLAVVAGGVGILTASRRSLGQTVVVGIGIIAAGVAVTRPDAAVTAGIPGLAAGISASVLLPILLRRLGAVEAYDRDSTRTGPAPRTDRRALVLTGGGVLLGSTVLAGLGRWWGARRLGVEDTRTTLPVPTGAKAPAPPGAELKVDGLGPWRTPNPVFYRIDTALSEPLVELADWRLRIHGMVDRPMTLTFDDLRRRPAVNRWVTLACVSNEVGGSLVGNALWTGVPIADILREVGVRERADALKSTSEDGWTCGTPLSALTDGRDALLAYAMNGEALPVEHGFPVRMVVPGLYGYVSATKWVVDLEVTRFDRFQAYWTTRGWSEQAPIKTASRIDVPRQGAVVSAGRVVVAGVAWAQYRGISRVEVRVDGGPWQQARLAGQPTKDAWRQWTFDWQAPPGEHRLAVRATDGAGATQTGALAPPAPNGATGWHSVDVTVE
ncbi:MAG TPA: molybdopterin-dependent oxidoreductase [Actinopolymorphaceae bacterium]